MSRYSVVLTVLIITCVWGSNSYAQVPASQIDEGGEVLLFTFDSAESATHTVPIDLRDFAECSFQIVSSTGAYSTGNLLSGGTITVKGQVFPAGSTASVDNVEVPLGFVNAGSGNAGTSITTYGLFNLLRGAYAYIRFYITGQSTDDVQVLVRRKKDQ